MLRRTAASASATMAGMGPSIDWLSMKSGAIGAWFTGDGGVDHERRIELRQELLRVPTDRKQASQHDTRPALVVDDDAHQPQDLVVGSPREDTASGRSKTPDEFSHEFGIEVPDRRARDRRCVVDRLALDDART